MQLELLYHVSFSDVETFVPRIPDGRATGEDAKTPRICFSTNVSKAITSMPGGGIALRGLMALRKKQLSPVIHLYMCKTWENENIRFIPPKKVQKRYHVPDAVDQCEWWALDTPQIIHRYALIEHAEFEDRIDSTGKYGVIVRGLRFEVIPELPASTPELFFKRKEYEGSDLRAILCAVDERVTKAPYRNQCIGV